MSTPVAKSRSCQPQFKFPLLSVAKGWGKMWPEESEVINSADLLHGYSEVSCIVLKAPLQHWWWWWWFHVLFMKLAVYSISTIQEWLLEAAVALLFSVCFPCLFISICFTLSLPKGEFSQCRHFLLELKLTNLCGLTVVLQHSMWITKEISF